MSAPTASDSSDSSDSSSEAWTGNEGESTDADEEVEAQPSLRGAACLVTASCPRKYPTELAVRKEKGKMIPEDFGKVEFLNKFRRIVGSHCNQRVEKATCHDEPHKRYRPSKSRRERHKLSAHL
eukprot:8376382-Karenia_brevis.AAC.1